MCVQKAITPAPNCNTCTQQCIDLSRINMDCDDVYDCVCWHMVDRVNDFGINPNLTFPTFDAAWNNFFSSPRTICQTLRFLQDRFKSINIQSVQITNIQARWKYRATIALPTNQRFRSHHWTPSSSNDAKWFVPNFNDTNNKWRQDQNIKMLDPALEIIADASHIIVPWKFNTYLATWYTSNGMSVNNVSSALSDRECTKWCPTIQIPYSWRYNVSLQGNAEVDHNVHAFRYAALRRNSSTHKLDLLVDVKYGNITAAGSGSCNNELIPLTKVWQMGGNKVLYLQKWDLVFPAIKIDPRTIWPKYTDIGPGHAQDVLYELNNVNPAFGTHNPGSASGMYVSRTPWHIDRNYGVAAGGRNINQDELPWMAANLPNVSPHFFTPSGGTWDWADAYHYNLNYPGWWASRDTYRRDDGCLTLYWPASFFNSDGQIWDQGDSIWASLSVNRVNHDQ